MREILFRGKTVDSGRWIFGDLSNYGDGYTGITTTKNFNIIDSAEVIPETVGQYTGLTDKNGNKIFEGDIVKESSGKFRLLCDVNKNEKEDKRTHIGVVEFGEHSVPSDDPFCWAEAYGFFVDGDVYEPVITKYRPEKDDYGNGFELEVIGNIYDNPELMGGNK